jgi:hypothetical protein
LADNDLGNMDFIDLPKGFTDEDFEWSMWSNAIENSKGKTFSPFNLHIFGGHCYPSPPKKND